VTTYTLQQLLPANIFVLLLVFARIGAALSLLPGIGDAYVSPRIRLMVAGGVTLLVTPILAHAIPPEPQDPVELFVLLFGEIAIGLFLGLVARVLFAALETGGAIIAMQANLSSALVFNPGAGSQETLPASFYGAFAVVMMFVTNTYGLLLRAIVDSYNAFPPGVMPPFDDMSEAMVRAASRSFVIAMELSAPYLIVATLFYALLGLIARIMPQLQVFYIGIPLQIMAGLFMLVLTLPVSIIWFLDSLQAAMNSLATAQ
jgi:flagellar biosynthetic protein FliR